jgi:hypothetical protein
MEDAGASPVVTTRSVQRFRSEKYDPFSENRNVRGCLSELAREVARDFHRRRDADVWR